MTAPDPAASRDVLNQRLLARVEELGPNGFHDLLYAGGLLTQLLMLAGHVAEVNICRHAELPFAAELATERAIEAAESALFLLDVPADC